MAILKITQTKSRIGATERQGRNLDALGLHKMNRTVYHEDSPVILGIVEKVRHLVTIETVSARPEKKAPRKAAAKAVKYILFRYIFAPVDIGKGSLHAASNTT